MKEISLEIGQFKFQDNYIVGTPELGADLNVRNCREILLLVKKHYKNKQIAYIGNREHCNSVDPLIYKALSEVLPNLNFMAIVAYSDHTRRIVEYEQMFATNQTLRVFNSLDDAITWVNYRLNK